MIATDVQCTACVDTSDLACNAVTAAKIKDGEVKAAEIATDAVGAAEIQGVTKLLFGRCILTSAEAVISINPGITLAINYTISGFATGDTAVATFNQLSSCFQVAQVNPNTGQVTVFLYNEFSTIQQPGSARIGVVVFHK